MDKSYYKKLLYILLLFSYYFSVRKEIVFIVAILFGVRMVPVMMKSN